MCVWTGEGLYAIEGQAVSQTLQLWLSMDCTSLVSMISNMLVGCIL